jgi:hypothetical protein
MCLNKELTMSNKENSKNVFNIMKSSNGGSIFKIDEDGLERQGTDEKLILFGHRIYSSYRQNLGVSSEEVKKMKRTRIAEIHHQDVEIIFQDTLMCNTKLYISKTDDYWFLIRSYRGDFESFFDFSNSGVYEVLFIMPRYGNENRKDVSTILFTAWLIDSLFCYEFKDNKVHQHSNYCSNELEEFVEIISGSSKSNNIISKEELENILSNIDRKSISMVKKLTLKDIRSN